MTDQASRDELPTQQSKRSRTYLVLGWILFALSPFVANSAWLDRVQFGFLALVLGIVGAVLIARAKERSTAWTAFLTVALIGLSLFAAVFIHNFLAYGAKARQSEAKINLSGIYLLEKEFYEKHKRYGTLDEIGFRLGSSPRYTLRIDQTGKPGTVILGTGVANRPITPDNSVVPAGFGATSFTATATANIDGDPTIDQWHVNDQKQGLQRADVDDVPYGWEWILALLMNPDKR